ncbi:MAG: hypothetical protein NVV72_18520 [Asticcacaulis sp.]|nr:hypothetical protein [Asticcacaulis sp.]
MKFLTAMPLIAALPLIPSLAMTSDLCMAGRKKALMEAQFSGPIVCSGKDATFILAGRTSGNELSIYDYRYRYHPLNGSVDHGGQRIVIFHGEKYVGQYALTVPSYVSISVDGSSVKIKSRDTSNPASLDFSKGPPRKIFVNGEVVELFR